MKKGSERFAIAQQRLLRATVNDGKCCVSYIRQSLPTPALAASLRLGREGESEAILPRVLRCHDWLGCRADAAETRRPSLRKMQIDPPTDQRGGFVGRECPAAGAPRVALNLR